MCTSMADIQSATAEIRRGKKERKKERRNHKAKNIMSASATQGGHKKHQATESTHLIRVINLRLQ